MTITGAVSVDALLAVANSYHQPEAREPGDGNGAKWLPAHDHLETPQEAMAYLGRHGLRLAERPHSRQLASLREIREAAQLFATNQRANARRVNQLLHGARFQLDAEGRLVPLRAGCDGLIDALLIALVELRGEADRIKRCGNDQCRWLFIDRSKNRSRQWCESATCGNRQRVRRFRRRAA
jgi:predicted RNA-binding Zn ribbon-like protein